MRRLHLLRYLATLTLVLSSPLSAQELDPETLEECTVGVASGKATPDNRPLLWKTRDTNAKNNEVVYFTDGEHKYLALVTAGQDSSAWAGVNERGFCIMNSLSTDFRRGRRSGMGNGAFMTRALSTCANVAEFEKMLDRTAKEGRRTRANFGVIDATGAAMVFETGATTHKRFDASDPEVAPEGFIVRSNFAISVDDAKTRARSIERYRRGNSICEAAVAKENLTARHLLREFCRDLSDNEGNPHPIPLQRKVGKAPVGTLDNNRCIARPSTRSAVVFHGVQASEHPDLTTFWVLLGEPIFSVAVPCWVRSGAVAPELDGEKQSPLCDAAITLTSDGYVTGEKQGRRSPPRYLDTANLPRIWEKTYPTEDQIFKDTARQLERWRKHPPSPGQMLKVHSAMARKAHECLRSLIPDRSPAK